jgi:hemoglobin-like flavoprotein
MTEREFQTIINKLDNLEQKVNKVAQDNQLLSEKIELYRQVGEAQITSIRQEISTFQEANQKQIEAFQEANKQQLNVSLGVLVTAAAAILVSVVLGMAN